MTLLLLNVEGKIRNLLGQTAERWCGCGVGTEKAQNTKKHHKCLTSWNSREPYGRASNTRYCRDMSHDEHERRGKIGKGAGVFESLIVT